MKTHISESRTPPGLCGCVSDACSGRLLFTWSSCLFWSYLHLTGSASGFAPVKLLPTCCFLFALFSAALSPPSFLFRYSHFLSILLCPSLLSVNYLKSHCDVPQHVFSHTGSVTQRIVCPSRHWLNYPNNYLVHCNLWRTRGADFLILPPSRQIPSSETGLTPQKKDFHQVMSTNSFFPDEEKYVNVPAGHLQPPAIVRCSDSPCAQLPQAHTLLVKWTQNHLFWIIYTT